MLWLMPLVVNLLPILTTFVTSFDNLPNQYLNHEDFGLIWERCSARDKGGFHAFNNFLSKDTQFCVPRTSLKELLAKELHYHGLPAHIDRDKNSGHSMEEVLLAFNMKKSNQICAAMWNPRF